MDKGKNSSKNRSGVLIICLIVAIVSFVAGTRSNQIIGAIAPVLGLRVSTESLELESIQETFRALKANYDGELDYRKLIYGANAGMVAATGDPHTSYLNPDDVEELYKSLNGNIGGGIGAEIGKKNDQLTILRPLKDSPAQKAGIQTGDVIVGVNDEFVATQTVEKVVEKIRGEIGTKVKLSLTRGDEDVEVMVTREEIKMPAVEGKIDGDVGVLTVSLFSRDTGSLARLEAEKFIDQGVKKVILDLRGNPGGEVPAAQALGGLWLDNQVLLTHRRGDKIVKTDKTTGKPILGDLETVVLINGGSASASEIVAETLREYGKATIVGEKSYGKGTVQSLIGLNDGSQLKVTESRWFTPKGKNIDKTGVEPDIEVELTADDFNEGRDPQLDKAKSL